MNFFAQNLKVFKKAALPLFVLVILSNNIDQYLNLRVENALQSPTGATAQLYVFGFFSILSSVIFPVLLMTTALFALSSLSSLALRDFFKKYLNQIFIESLRAWGKTLLWSLLLVIPGVWKYLELSLVPFVVTASQKYDEGNLDALQGSTFVFRRHWFKILAVLFIFHLFVPLILTSLFDSYRLIWKTPIASLLLSLLDTYLILVSTQLLFNIFQNEVRKHESHV